MKAIKFHYSFILCLFSFALLAQTYEIEQLSVEPFSDVIKRTGTLNFKRVQNVSFKSSGYLTKLTVDSGDYFVKGQLLASLDIQELNAQKNAAYANLLHAKRELNRAQNLHKKQLSSERDLDVANTLVETTRAAYQIIFYNVEKAQIIAPFSGVVLSRYSEIGEFQSPGQEAFQIAALENNYVIKVALTESEVNQVYLKQPVQVLLNKIGKTSGVITKVPVIANVDGHLFEIEISLPQLSLKSGLIAGQLAEIVIDFQSENFVYKLPVKALMSVDEQGKALVMTKQTNSNKFEKKAFDIYKLDNNFVYLRANIYDSPLNIVTQGWQNISLSEY